VIQALKNHDLVKRIFQIHYTGEPEESETFEKHKSIATFAARETPL
jgi:hypothetical protein